MRVDDVIARLADRVPELAGRIGGAASLAQLMAQNQLPQQQTAAQVISTGLSGGAPDAAAGLYRQSFDETITVILTFRHAGATGALVLERLDEVKMAVICAIAGWEPEGAMSPFRLVRGQVVNMAAGTLIYSIDFALGDQLRIVPS